MSDRFTAQKLSVLDQIMRDPRATHLDFRVAYYVGSVTDRKTGEARFKQITGAEALGITRRALQISTQRLRDLEYIDVSFTPGRTHFNGYRLRLERATLSAPADEGKANGGSPFRASSRDDSRRNGGSLIAAIDRQLDEIKGEQGFAYIDGKGERIDEKRRTASIEKANRHSHQSSLAYIPCVIPVRARDPASVEALGSLRAELVSRIGEAPVVSWFGKTEIVDVTDGVVTFGVESPFVQSRIMRDYELILTDICKKLLPPVCRVRVVLASQWAVA
ncbi:hypothetical protein V5279_23535 [Bradyrhizobium sp. 26S5]|uniref:hypothetical protein n=1 Tax=Bradyrhizobium sp. 26S5 TaxID=3139729 RepID=UPI0030D2D4E8